MPFLKLLIKNKLNRNIGRHRIHDKSFLPMYDECLACLIAGNYRAGYVLAWTMIAESIRKRIEKYADEDLPQAKVAMRDIAGRENAKQSADSIIVKKGLELNLIRDTHKDTLDYLYNQRCMYAHPYSEYPTFSDLQHILGAAVEVTLSAIPKLRKPQIDALLLKMREDKLLLLDNADRIKAFAESKLTQVEADLKPYLFKSLLGEVGAMIESGNMQYLLRFRVFLIELILCIEENLEDSDYRLMDFIGNHPATCVAGFLSAETLEFLPATARQHILEHCITNETEGVPIDYRESTLLRIFLTSEVLSWAEFRRIIVRLQKLDSSASVFSKIPYRFCAQKARETFQKNIYKDIKPMVSILRLQSAVDLSRTGSTRLFRLGISIMHAALGNSWAAQDLIVDYAAGRGACPFPLGLGLFIGAVIFPHDYDYYIRAQYLPSVGSLLPSTLDSEQRNWARRAITGVIRRVRKEHPTALKRGSINFFLRDIQGHQKMGADAQATVKKVRRLSWPLPVED